VEYERKVKYKQQQGEGAELAANRCLIAKMWKENEEQG